MPEDHSERYWKTIERAYDAVSIYDGVKIFQQQYGQLRPDVARLLAVHWCVSEIFNGGFHPFFYNDTGALAPEAADAFEAFGMDRCAAIVRRAMARLGPCYPRSRLPRMIRLLLAQALHFKSSEKLFDPEDAEFYDRYDTEAGGYEKAGLHYLNSRQT